MAEPFVSIPTTATFDDIRHANIDEALKKLFTRIDSVERLQEQLASLPIVDPNVTGAFFLKSGVVTVSSGTPG